MAYHGRCPTVDDSLESESSGSLPPELTFSLATPELAFSLAEAWVHEGMGGDPYHGF